MNKTDIPFLSAVALGELIRERKVSAVEATESYLDRIEAVDGKLNSYVTVCREEALEAAREMERAIYRGEYFGPLHGVPFAVKDQFWSKNVRTTGGSTILADFIPDEDATVVSRMKQAGAVLLGKLNMTEFAGDSDHDPYGTARNPWDLSRDPGTSSSGSGIATAAFLCATSLGEDTGGSIRNPASNCGLVGLSPTWGLVSRYGMFGISWSLDTGGPISRTVGDCAITLQAIAGHDPHDPHTARIKVPDYRAGLYEKIKGIRIGVIKEAIEADFVEPSVRVLVSNAIAELGKMGASIQEVSIPLLMQSASIGRVIGAVEGASAHHAWIRTRLDEYDRGMQVNLVTGSVIPAQLYYKAQRLRDLVRHQVMAVLQKVDILALPTTHEPAPIVGKRTPLMSKEDALTRMTPRRNFTGVFNLSNLPAMSLPCGFVRAEGKDLPIGLQLAAHPFGDGLLLRVGHAYEQATLWHTRRPPNIYSSNG